ncbi:YdgA family protein [Legionella septentrionalis]|uniref:YdgA family protein n=1 Tax=Legionella septentrionalis TaxID=2498109 RepID=UPI000F8C767E|nr:YdgA family protein [Legionella septentrionalis]RUR16501.1 DUF945 domain-containing protein [Legionella septentrionalis]
MNKIIGLVVILAALVLGSYYGTGLITERTLKKNVAMINQSNGGVYIDLQEYKRGWFTSTAQLKWRLQIPERVSKDDAGQSVVIPAKDYTVDMPLTVYHGPVIFADKGVRFGLGYAYTNLNMPAEYMDQFNSNFTAESTKPQVDLSVLVNYLNRSRLRVEIPKFVLIPKDAGGRFEWMGMTNDVTISSNMKSVDGDLVIDGMSFTKDNTKAVLEKINSDYEFEQTKEGLYVGEADLSVPSLLVTENQKPVFELKEFYANSSSDIDDGLFNTYFKMTLDKVVSNGKTYGPGVLNMSLKNLDAEVLGRINTQVNKMQQGTPEQQQQALMALIPELPKLFSKGAEFRISELNFAIPEGKLEGTLVISLPKADTDNPFQLIQKTEGDGKIKLPVMLVKNLMKQSISQQLKGQQSLPQPQPSNSSQNDGSTDAAAATTTQSQQQAQTEQPQQTTAQQPTQLTPAQIDEQAEVQTEKKLADLVQAGVLSMQGDYYVVELKLANGQLTVNGQPFNPAVMKI